jgi:hypothetical protein
MHNLGWPVHEAIFAAVSAAADEMGNPFKHQAAGDKCHN